MTIQLNPEQQSIVERALRAGVIRAVDEVAEIGVGVIRDRLNMRHAASAQSAEEWFREFTAWSESHSTSTPLLPDEAIGRDSIYGERGL